MRWLTSLLAYEKDFSFDCEPVTSTLKLRNGQLLFCILCIVVSWTHVGSVCCLLIFTSSYTLWDSQCPKHVGFGIQKCSWARHLTVIVPIHSSWNLEFYSSSGMTNLIFIWYRVTPMYEWKLMLTLTLIRLTGVVIRLIVMLFRLTGVIIRPTGMLLRPTRLLLRIEIKSQSFNSTLHFYLDIFPTWTHSWRDPCYCFRATWQK